MFDSVNRYQDLFRNQGKKTLLLDGVLWTHYQKMIVPIGPVSHDHAAAIKRSQDALLHFFKECILIRGGGGFVKKPDAWYVILCDTPYDLANLSANTRSKVRRGLNNCIVRRIDAQFMVQYAWSVFSSGFRRYKKDWLRTSEEQFRKNIALTNGFDDIVHYWGVFEKETGKFIAYAQNYLYDKTEVYYWIIRFRDDFLRLYPSYALFYEMNRYYLNKEKFLYANAGFRSLLHETNIQEYLTEKFFFRRQPIRLIMHYRFFAGACMSLTYPYRQILGKLYQPLAAFYKLEEIKRS
ncbi:MAG: hypothetical protein WC473_05885 [Patescibacteria group bacterium]